MPYNLSVPQVIYRDSSFWLCYYAGYGVPLTSDTPTFLTGPDDLEVVPGGYPYPSGGLNLGLINGRIKISKGAELKDQDPPSDYTVSQDRYFASYKRQIEFEIISSGRRRVVDLFDDPGPRSSSDSYGGGLQDAPDSNLVMMFHDQYHPDRFMCMIHWSVTPLPADIEIGSDAPQTLRAVFRCYAGTDPDDANCPRDEGMMIWRRLYLNANAEPIDPDTGETVSGNSPDDYPALSMQSGMLG